MSNLSALVGAILFAWLPEDEHPHRPGPKYRPVLVVGADPTTKRLCLAYGTSQRVEENGRGEITFRKEEVAGLRKDTKFCLGKTKWIPLDTRYFARTPSEKRPTVLGYIPDDSAWLLKMRLEEVMDQ